eukprot:scaffold125602_cov33-Cyclotella_meneghiniana.AAC.4
MIAGWFGCRTIIANCRLVATVEKRKRSHAKKKEGPGEGPRDAKKSKDNLYYRKTSSAKCRDTWITNEILLPSTPFSLIDMTRSSRLPYF